MNQEQKVWYKKTWVIVLLVIGGLIFLPIVLPLLPIVAIVLIWKQKGWSKSIKIGSTAAVLVTTLFVLVAYGASKSHDIATTKVPSDQAQQVSDAIDASSSTPTAPTEVSSLPASESGDSNRGVVSSNNKEVASDLYTVVAVVDGDTFKVSMNGNQETLRMIGIDTPETVDPRKAVQCFGVEASNKAKALLTGKRVRLEADSTQGERDKYGRLLRYAFLEDGRLFNKLMIGEGYAREYTYDSAYKYQAEFKQAELTAKTAKQGLWADDACITAAQPVPTPTQNPSPVTSPAPSSEAAAEPTPRATPPTGHTFYTSSHPSSRYYYCDTDDGWKGLSSSNLKSFPSAEQLLAKYPNRTLHEPCK